MDNFNLMTIDDIFRIYTNILLFINKNANFNSCEYVDHHVYKAKYLFLTKSHDIELLRLLVEFNIQFVLRSSNLIYIHQNGYFVRSIVLPNEINNIILSNTGVKNIEKFNLMSMI